MGIVEIFARRIAVAQQTVAVETVGFAVLETAEIAVDLQIAVGWQTVAAGGIVGIVVEEIVEIAVDLQNLYQ